MRIRDSDVDPTLEFAMTNKLIQYVEKEYLKKDMPQFRVGDTVDVHTKIVEGEKERIQIFSGTVIMRKGAGINETFTVRRIVNNETRRAKLFYLRKRVGKAVRLTESRKVRKEESAPPSSESSQEQPALAGAGT
jgi:large subunit ribosomal protein L19